MRVHQLQILRDELDIDQSADSVFEVPALAVAFFLGDGAAHFHHVAGDLRDVARALQNFADDLLDPRAEPRRGRDHARARERHVLPGPGLGLLVAGEAANLGGQRPGPSGRAQPHIDVVKRAVIGLRGQ